MALNVCAGCTALFAVGLKKCPQCGSTDFQEDGAMSPKITNHGGASIAGAEVTGGQWGDDTETEEAPTADSVREDSGTDEPMTAVAGNELVGDGSGRALPPIDPDETSVAPDYGDWTGEQLKNELDARGLAKSGKKDDLIARLREDDAARTAEPETE